MLHNLGSCSTNVCSVSNDPLTCRVYTKERIRKQRVCRVRQACERLGLEKLCVEIVYFVCSNERAYTTILNSNLLLLILWSEVHPASTVVDSVRALHRRVCEHFGKPAYVHVTLRARRKIRHFFQPYHALFNYFRFCDVYRGKRPLCIASYSLQKELGAHVGCLCHRASSFAVVVISR